MITYQTGETVRMTATITDSGGAAADPATTKISVAKPGGTLAVDGVAMTKSATGIYYYNYTIGSDVGTYKVQVKATGSGGRITIVPDVFAVEASI